MKMEERRMKSGHRDGEAMRRQKKGGSDGERPHR
jgi:hypothetical protein